MKIPLSNYNVDFLFYGGQDRDQDVEECHIICHSAHQLSPSENCLCAVHSRWPTVLEIKDLFCAHAGSMYTKSHAPGSMSVSSFQYKYINKLGKACTCRVHRLENVSTGPLNCAHQVQGAPLIFEHWPMYS